MTDTTAVKLVKTPDGYATEDGRFQIDRPLTRSDSWCVTDTERWTWHYGYRDPNAVEVEPVWISEWNFAAAKRYVAARLADDYTYRSNVYPTEAEARAAGEAARVEDRRVRRERAEREAQERRAALALHDHAAELLAAAEAFRDAALAANCLPAAALEAAVALDTAIAHARGRASRAELNN